MKSPADDPKAWCANEARYPGEEEIEVTLEEAQTALTNAAQFATSSDADCRPMNPYPVDAASAQAPAPGLAGGRAGFVRAQIPPGGLLAGLQWRIAPTPFRIGPELAKEFEVLGRVLLQFKRAANLLYRLSVAGKQPPWVAEWLDRGKPADLIALQRSPVFKHDLPRVIRPDILLTESGFSITELDNVPGGIGLTAWLNKTYTDVWRGVGSADSPAGVAEHGARPPSAVLPRRTGNPPTEVLGGTDAMLRGFDGIFSGAPRVHVVLSEEAKDYRPEMVWLCEQLGNERFQVRDSKFANFRPGDAVYRFFELFDEANVENASTIFKLAQAQQLRLTPPPKAFLEEKMLFALLWNRNLRGFWRQELGEGFFNRLLKLVPYTWIVDPAPLPPHAAIPELDLTDWHQLKALSQRERELILKVSGYSEHAWGARGVYLGSDLSAGEWAVAVDRALSGFERTPFILQRYHKPRVVEFSYFDFERSAVVPTPGRVRLCPYYFVHGEGDAARAHLGGVLATVCPADKKIIHGMRDAILAPCAV
jgi:hypothetical protein